jgi:hypothetical protein
MTAYTPIWNRDILNYICVGFNLHITTDTDLNLLQTQMHIYIYTHTHTHTKCVREREKNQMGGAYSAYGGKERRIQGFGGET